MLEVVAEEFAPRREVELMLADMEPEASQESRSAIAEATRDAQAEVCASELPTFVCMAESVQVLTNRHQRSRMFG